VEWSEFDFIQPKLEEPDPDRHSHVVLTGWETVVFELEDVKPEDDPR
jgi:hypothetical protein